MISIAQNRHKRAGEGPGSIPGEHSIAVPLGDLFPQEVQLVQGTVTRLDRAAIKLLYTDNRGLEQALHYDVLVMAAGSVVRQPGLVVP
ncbi:hypothetical protein [Paenibacillus thiaminolyticus]|uniref:hypothetical protein n=1 Tax=Paenibacillus thiaminolyticus TaxID=49283 RepID=UPI002542A324|nr:hypothetical protein [Paenibacillus thiaminolyticus]WII37730.1 hypothetical protein O0V01_00765 [Paenibacillus thiaminolyticus]